MDQKRIGSFLKELRKEKELTQEQLAEHFHVSNRTISRWENGNNMPDLAILVELADFYDVDIREIIDGERKSENMNHEEKEKMLLMAEYAEEEKQTLLKRLRKISIVGLCAMIVGFVLLSFNGQNSLPVEDYLMGMSFGLAFGALITAVLYSTGTLAKIRNAKANVKSISVAQKIILAVCVLVCVITFAASIAASF